MPHPWQFHGWVEMKSALPNANDAGSVLPTRDKATGGAASVEKNLRRDSVVISREAFETDSAKPCNGKGCPTRGSFTGGWI